MLPTYSPSAFTFTRTTQNTTSAAEKTLIAIPEVINQMIVDYPGPEDLQALAQVSRSFRTLSEQSTAWQRFIKPEVVSKKGNWHAAFKNPANRLDKFLLTDEKGAGYLQKKNPLIHLSPTIVNYIKLEKMSVLEFELLNRNTDFVVNSERTQKKILDGQLDVASVLSLSSDILNKLARPGVMQLFADNSYSIYRSR